MSNNYGLAILPILAGAFMLLSLTGCGLVTTRTEHVQTEIHIPKEKFECGVKNIIRPSGDKIMESEISKYIATLEFSEKDCKIRNKEIEIIIECYNDPKCNIDHLIKYMGVVREANPS